MDQIKTGELTQNVRAVFFLQKVVDKIVFYVIIETEVAQQLLRNKRRRKRSDDKCRQNANLQEMR